MKFFHKSYFTLFVVCYFSILLLKCYHVENVSRIVIPLFVFMAFAFAFYINFRKVQNHIFLIGAFAFILIGDTLINLTPYGKYSVITFCISHIFFILYFISLKNFETKEILYLIPISLVSLLIFNNIHNNIQSKSLIYIFAVYLMVLSFMLWRAICTIRSSIMVHQKTIIILGAFLFYCTDILVSINVLYHLKAFVILTWIVYPPALYLLSNINIQSQKVGF